MLDHLGHSAEATRINAAVEADIANRKTARSTTEIGNAIAALV